ncbi:hypothetical protein [Spirilliplanes yamanashiensis]|uniref:Uncharacterized protein n=1 Tax=Spirilliplanes yamanashiensis TaxID=42233 RepID=A0A8J4DLH6_9ACTN|nr:hypothetical protein [Spirilliplanes yamanashiensis]MDP9818943.1 hypothetical protein [Spirilliplanes yamanashiensis]GIJ05398.1 hypothetical protein Sya03_47500 [Spirilliplanes yamanashiensis]
MPSYEFWQPATGEGVEVWIRDERADGTVVMLVCREADRRAAAPGPEVCMALPAQDGGVYPMLTFAGREPRRPRRVLVDTTRLPAGIQRFRLGAFGRRAIEAARAGRQDVRLTADEARQWGHVAPAAADAPATVSIPVPADRTAEPVGGADEPS